MTWWNASWGYRKKITLLTSTYLSGNITNDHTIYIKQTSANTDFWSHVKSNGSDVRFVAADDSTELKFYFQRFDDTNDLMEAWVKVTDTFTSATNVFVYMYYGNVDASDAQDAANTLTNCLAVYHCDEGTGTTVSDKKGTYNATATNSAIWDTSTQKKGAAGLNPAAAYTAANDTLLDTPPTNLSISFWFNPTAIGYKFMAGKQNAISPYNFIEITYTVNNLVRVNTAHNGVENNILFSTTTFSTGTWYNAIVTWNTTDGVILFVNGAAEAQDVTATSVMDAGTQYNFTIGGYGAGGLLFNGKIDEVKVMNVGITTDEAKLLYRSENDDLQSYGSEEFYGQPVTVQPRLGWRGTTVSNTTYTW